MEDFLSKIIFYLVFKPETLIKNEKVLPLEHNL